MVLDGGRTDHRHVNPAIRIRPAVLAALAILLTAIIALAGASRAAAAQAPTVHSGRQVATGTAQVHHRRHSHARHHRRLVAYAAAKPHGTKASVTTKPHGTKKPVAYADGNLTLHRRPRKVARKL